MQKLDFDKEAREMIAESVQSLKEKRFTKGMADLNEVSIAFDKIVQDLSEKKYGIGLLPSKKQANAVLTEHRFYILAILSEDRKQMIAPLDVVAVRIDGNYPVCVLAPDETPVPLNTIEAIKARMLDHCMGNTVANLIWKLKQ